MEPLKNVRSINLENTPTDEAIKNDFVKTGAFGSVQRLSINSYDCAVKYFHKREQFSKNLSEVVNLNMCKHENIVELIGAGPDLEKNCLHYFIMEFAPHGSLDDLLHEQKNVKYNLTQGLEWIKQCCSAVDYMHSNFKPPFLHRDIKPSNLLLFDHATKVKLCDFGTVKKVQNMDNTVESGTFLYMAPEVMVSVRERSAQYNEKCDVYSIAVVLWEILTRTRPFSDINNTFHIIMKVAIKKENLPDIPGCPEMLLKLIKCCWQYAFKNRPDVATVLKVLTLYLDKMYSVEPLVDLNCRNYSVNIPRFGVDDTEDDNTGSGNNISGAAGGGATFNFEESRSPSEADSLTADDNNIHSDENYNLQLELIDENLKPKEPLQGNIESKMIFEQHTVLLKRYVYLNLDCQKLEMDNNHMLNELSSDKDERDRIKRYCALKIKQERESNLIDSQ